MTSTTVGNKTRLVAAFERGASEKRALVMPFLVCGYPDPDTFVEIAAAAAAGGADVLEIGIPFSDPVMDGPVIQEATSAVLERGLRVDEALELIGRVAERTALPLVAMTYYNLAFRRGLNRFAESCAQANVSGVILPDLSVEESADWIAACRAAKIAPIFLAATNSSPERLAAIATVSEGFIYGASLLGVTGVRDAVSSAGAPLVGRIRAASSLPVALGIGVSTPEHARAVSRYADGVIVGSALVRLIAAADDPVKETEAFVRSLRDAVSP